MNKGLSRRNLFKYMGAGEAATVAAPPAPTYLNKFLRLRPFFIEGSLIVTSVAIVHIWIMKSFSIHHVHF